MSTIIEGLHTCKPKNAPTVGAIKAFIIENRGDWNKIRNPKKQDGEVGIQYRITKADKTDYSDAHGNVSFNVELERVFGNAHTGNPQEYGDGSPDDDQTRVYDRKDLQKATQSTQDARGDVLDPILETRQHLMRACNLYNLCVDAVNSAIVPHLPEGARMSAEQLQSTLASIWIEASSRRSTDGISWWSYIDKMPGTPIKTKPKAQPNDDDEETEVPF